MQHRKSALVTVFTAVILQFVALLPTARADFFNYHKNYSGFVFPTQQKAGVMTDIDIRFDSYTQELGVEAKFAPAADGTIPEGFALMVTDGADPRNGNVQPALFYYEARSLDKASLRLSVYAYNGNLTDWSDGIHPVLDDVFPLELIARDEGNKNDGTYRRVLGFRIETKKINEHTPKTPIAGKSWAGAKIGTEVGYYLKAVHFKGDLQYGADGFLKVWPGECYSVIEAKDHKSLNCVGVEGTYEATIGKEFTKVVVGTDDTGDLLKWSVIQNPVIIPPMTVAADEKPGTTTLTFNWTPADEHGGKSYYLCPKFEDAETKACCPFKVRVPEICPGGAKKDRCGICGGDGTSCLGCEDKDITSLLFALDGSSIKQRKTLRKALRRLERLSQSISTKKYVAKTLVRADELHNANWTITWTLPQVSTTCTNVDFCAHVSNSWVVNNYNANAQEMYNLFVKTQKRISKALKKVLAPLDLKNQAKADAALKEALELSATIPATQSSCQK